MGLMAIAILAGVAAAALLGPRAHGTGPIPLRWVPALVAGAAGQWLVEVVDVPDAVGLVAVLVPWAAVLAFAAGNLAHTGMPLVLLGVALNVAVIAPNGGMPVRADAIVEAGIAERGELARIDLGTRRHLEAGDDVLRPLGDVLPLRPLREVVSVGDVVLAAGIATVTCTMLRAPQGGRWRRRRATAHPLVTHTDHGRRR